MPAAIVVAGARRGSTFPTDGCPLRQKHPSDCPRRLDPLSSNPIESKAARRLSLAKARWDGVIFRFKSISGNPTQ